jgi:DNA-directed RNA polymerase III subunit RPC4
MVPAGPFAMGPVAAGLAGVSRQGTSYRSGPSADKSGKSQAAVKSEYVSSLPRNRDQLLVDDTQEVYSDEDGDIIVDLEEVKVLDFMAPDALKKEKRKEKKGKTRVGIKPEPIEDRAAVKNESQALDLSESEEEVELENLQQHFVMGEDGVRPFQIKWQIHSNCPQGSLEDGQLYFFQFPDPFPIFEPPAQEEPSSIVKPGSPGKRVSFAEDVKPSSGVVTPQQDHLAGLIGQLEIHQSGAVRMKLANNITYDVNVPSWRLSAQAHDWHRSLLPRNLHSYSKL